MDNENDSNNDIQENSESNHYSKELEPEDANLQVETTTLDVKCEFQKICKNDVEENFVKRVLRNTTVNEQVKNHDQQQIHEKSAGCYLEEVKRRSFKIEPTTSNNDDISKNLRSRFKTENSGAGHFSVGDDILCYEPDSNRTRLLYEAKILDKFLKDDEAGNKTEYYRVHFHGWSNAWDRDVSTDYVLKDTSENRRLKNQLERQAYGEKCSTSQESNERYKISENDRKSILPSSLSHSTKDAEQQHNETSSRQVDVKMSARQDSSNSNDGTEFKTEHDMFEFDHKFQYLTAYDQFLVEEKKMLLDLPTMPSVVSVLCHFLMHYATHDLKDYMYKNPGLTCTSLCNRIQLLREFADNIRTCFDAILGAMLLYEEERVQFQLITLAMSINENPGFNYDIEYLIPKYPPITENDDDYCADQDISSIYEDDTAEGHSNYASGTRTKGSKNKSKRRYSIVENSRYGLRDKNHSVYDKYMKTLFPEQVLAWEIAPKNIVYQRPYLPSFIYGPIHLARFLVQFPRIISKSLLSDAQTGPLLLHFFHSLMKFLCEHEEWFAEENYIPAADAEQLPKLETD